MTPELREKLLAFGNGAEPFLQHNHFCVEDVDDGTSLVTLELQRENLNRWGAPTGGRSLRWRTLPPGWPRSPCGRT